jgi:hypothetical protein
MRLQPVQRFKLCIEKGIELDNVRILEVKNDAIDVSRVQIVSSGSKDVEIAMICSLLV